MKFDCKFHSLDYSSSLVEYVEERFQKLKKLELKPLDVHVTFSADRHNKLVEVYIKGLSVPYRAKAATDDFRASVDKVMHKIMRQMGKEKGKIQHHKSPDCTAESRLEQQIAEEKELNRVS